MRAVLVLLLASSLSAADPPRRQPVVLTDAARDIHKEALLVDGHNDPPWQFTEQTDLSFRVIDVRRPQKPRRTVVPRPCEVGRGGQFWRPTSRSRP